MDMCTVVVYEVGDADAEERRVQPRVKSGDALALYDAARRVEGG